MNLAFSTTWNERMGELAGQPTYFVRKIMNGLINEGLINSNVFDDFAYKYMNTFHEGLGTLSPNSDFPKLHTIREDPHDRWKVGNKIHFTINNRTKDRFQFAPILEVVDEYRIIINPINKEIHKAKYIIKSHKEVIIGHGEELDANKIAINDGFDTIDDFFRWFYNEGKVFIPKIIHWTDLKY